MRAIQATGLALIFVLACVACGATYMKFYQPNFTASDRTFEYTESSHKFRLANGLTVLLLPDANTNLVKVDARYRVGAAEDPGNKSGLAHLVEHLMFEVRGADASAPKLGERLTSVALSHNAYTIWDETHYTATALERNLKPLLEIEADRLATTCDRLDDVSLASEKDVVRSELRQRASLGQRIGQLIRTQVYGQNHAYTRPVGGTLRQVASVTRKDVCGFIRNYHSPERTILVVAGHFSVGDTKKLIKRTLGRVAPRRSAPRARIIPAKPRPGGTQITMPVKQSTIFFVSTAPVFSDIKSDGHDALRWFLEFRINRKVAGLDYVTHVDISRMGGLRAPLLVAAITVNDPTKLPEVEKLFFTARQELGDELHAGMLEARGTRQTASLLAELSRLSERSGRFADYVQYSDGTLTPKKVLRRLRDTDTDELTFKSAPFFERWSTFIIRVVPDPASASSKTKSNRVSVQSSAKTYDVSDWSQPVDLRTLDKDLPMPTARMRQRVESFVLQNGLRVLLVPSMKYPLVEARMVFPAGALRSARMPGVARLTASLLDIDRSQKVHRTDIPTLNWVLKNGGEVERNVTWRATSFRIAGLSNYTDALIWRLHWVLESGALIAKDLGEKKKAAKPADAKRYARNRRRTTMLSTALFGKTHPYSMRRYGPDALRPIGVAHLRAFRKRHYHLNGATLIVTGQFNAKQVSDQIRRLYSRWPAGGQVPSRDVIPQPRQRSSAERFILAEKTGSQVRVAIAFTTRSGYGKGHAARLVLGQVLRQRVGKLRSTLGSTYGINVGESINKGPGLLSIGGAIDNSRAVQTFKALRKAIDDVRSGKQLAEAFLRARRKILQQILANSVNSRSVANELQFLTVNGLGASYYSKLATRISKLRLADIQRLIREEMAPTKEVIVGQGVEKTVSEMFRAAGITGARVIR